ncbi:Putative phosphoserine phosphatase 2 [Usitatibacter rugosus]|uniref:Phosphoserine phosphatase 2 n=1 Tax=Usitatibacter rugosus TaxID=2732067 RepID=A0A6M4GWB5_9PROT|nr:histidine phosphatase family protein [Usitatibacter rugosus]QJR11516.1 Putative phosphoserine phosphatase 2 [Usitatibacter rugosus]
MSTRFVILRHGETQWNVESRIQGHTDSELTMLGWKQAAALGRRMEGEKFDVLISSDLGRAYNTADSVATRTGHEIVSDPRLRERSFGVAEGLTYGELDHQFPDAFSRVRETDPDFVIPGGETRRQFQDRVKSAFESIAAEYPEKRVVVVCHGGVLAALYRVMHGIAVSAPHPIPIANASFNAVAFDGTTWTTELWGDTGHLAAGALLEEA